MTTIQLKKNGRPKLKCLEAEFEHEEYQYQVFYTLVSGSIRINEVRRCHLWREADYSDPLTEIDADTYDYIIDYLTETIVCYVSNQ